MSLQILSRREATPLLRQRPRPSRSWVVFEDGSGMAACLSPRVIAQALGWAARVLPYECLGLLVGRYCEDSDGPYTLVDGAVLAARSRVSVAFVRVDAQEVASAVEQIRTRFPLLDAVGWVHSHTGFGAYFSSTDRRTQEQFRAPGAVGLVVDPTRSRPQLAVFMGPRSTQMTLRSSSAAPGYSEVPWR